ncbi:MAG: glycosyltransferase [archaeon]|nr:glycosyltransferase [archaeon]
MATLFAKIIIYFILHVGFLNLEGFSVLFTTWPLFNPIANPFAILNNIKDDLCLFNYFNNYYFLFLYSFKLMDFFLYFEIFRIFGTFAFCNFFVFVIFIVFTQLIYFKRKRQEKKNKNTKIVTFIHPNCSDFGGGEKVLWFMINSLISPNLDAGRINFPELEIRIISSGKVDEDLLRQKLEKMFNISLDERHEGSSLIKSITFVEIPSAYYLLKPQRFATMILQMFGQMVFAFDILRRNYSDSYIDTTGLPFTYLILSWFGHASVSAYVHYPFISEDMIRDIKNGIQGVHSRGLSSKFKWIIPLKIYYYRLMLLIYKINGYRCKTVLCNSSWTKNHMDAIWKIRQTYLLYPPCSTKSFSDACASANAFQKKNIIVSFAQFRPEKNHIIQVNIMQKLLKNGRVPNDLELHMIGGVRNQEDEIFVQRLQMEIDRNGLSSNIKIRKNLDFEDVAEEFKEAKIGIHTMRDEHFGISVVEMMAAGLIVIAHNSAGAKLDIIGPSEKMVGFVVNNEDHYVSTIEEILNNYNLYSGVSRDASFRAEMFGYNTFQSTFYKLFISMI